MWFNSFSFLWFFPAVLILYCAIPGWRARKFLLLAASYFFYACWNPPFVLLLVGSSAWDYTCGRLLGVVRDPLRRKLLVAASCVTNFGVLFVFKYSGLVFRSLPWIATPDWVTHVVLPVGISFYTFHGVSYVIDVYRGKVEVEHSLLDFMLFVAFFPQLVAGPILRAWYFVPQLHTKRTNTQLDWLRGSYLIILGLFQKMAVADNLAPLANLVFDNPGKCNTAELWLGVYAFAFQIYFDFAGYSNIAIGCARLLGFEIPENFRVPYIAAGFREFWRRWHISLSTWLRDYLYIPLGGNRGSTARTIRNLFIVMSLGGLWHGANWTFVVWGALHGAYLAAEHLLQPVIARVPEGVRRSLMMRVVMVVVTFHLTCVAWVFFRATTIGSAASMVTEMLLPSILRITITTTATPYVVVSIVAVLLALIAKGRGIAQRVPGWAWGVTAALMLFVTIVSWGDPNAFIYFRF